MRILISVSRQLPITEEMLRQARGNKLAGHIEMDARSFLDLTCPSQAAIREIMKEALPLDQYIEFAEKGENIHMPWLDICMDGMRWSEPYLRGRVTGHEGRHRAAAVIRSGQKTFRVALSARYNGYTANKVEIDDTKPWLTRPVVASDFPEVFHGQFNQYVKYVPNFSTFKPFNH